MSAHGCRFSFTPLPGFFSPFPHGTLRYRSPRLFSLGTWSSPLPTRFLVSGGTYETMPGVAFSRYGALTRSGGPSQGPSRKSNYSGGNRRCVPSWSVQPPPHIGQRATQWCGFRLFPVRSPLLRESRVDFSAEGTEMFQFPCGPPLRVTITGGVSPFGDRRIKGGKTPPRRFRCQAPSFIGSAAPGHSPCAVMYLRVLAHARLPTRFFVS